MREVRVFLDENYRAVDPKDAVIVRISYYDGKGKFVREIWARKKSFIAKSESPAKEG